MLENIGAGEGNRTLVISLEGCCSTIELHPRMPGTLPEILVSGAAVLPIGLFQDVAGWSVLERSVRSASAVPQPRQ
jgi:hypothetical protein